MPCSVLKYTQIEKAKNARPKNTHNNHAHRVLQAIKKSRWRDRWNGRWHYLLVFCFVVEVGCELRLRFFFSLALSIELLRAPNRNRNCRFAGAEMHREMLTRATNGACCWRPARHTKTSEKHRRRTCLLGRETKKKLCLPPARVAECANCRYVYVLCMCVLHACSSVRNGSFFALLLNARRRR